MLSFKDNKEKELKTFYEKGILYKDLNMPGAAIKFFTKCIDCTEAESYKAYYELSKIYVTLKDYNAAYDSCIHSIKLNPQHIEALYYAAHILKIMKMPMQEFKKILKSFSPSIYADYTFAADIFYVEGYYETALDYITKCNASDSINFIKVKCLLRSSRYAECLQYISTLPESNLYFFKIMTYKIICFIIIGEYESAWNILSKFNYYRLNSCNQKLLSVYIQFYNLMTARDTSILCEDETDSDYTLCIFEIYDILLDTKEFNCFEKALNLINLISDKSVLLQLGKLYYKYGYVDMAKKEILRSIQEFDLYDSEGLDILR